MSVLKEFEHIDLKWEVAEGEKRRWNLIFDKEILLSIKQGSWFSRHKIYASSHFGNWSIKKNGKNPCVFEIKERSLIGRKLFELGFRNKLSEGMFNPTEVDTFRWKKIDGKRKGMAWHQSDLEVVRFEKKGMSLTSFNYEVSFIKGDHKDIWIMAMIVVGFLVLKGV